MTTPPTPPAPTDGPPAWGRWLLAAGLAAGAGVVLVFGPDEQAVIRRAGEWRAAARDHLPLALALFVLAEVTLVALSVPVGIWLTVLAGFLFGVWVGTAAVGVASTTGAVLVFLLARHAFAAPLRRAAAARPRVGRAVAAVDRGFRDHGAYYVLLLRLTPVFPFWVLNLGLALTPVRLRDYAWATLAGMLPITLVVCHAGARLAEVESVRDVLSVRVLLALCLMPAVPFALHQLAGRWLRKDGEPRA